MYKDVLRSKRSFLHNLNRNIVYPTLLFNPIMLNTNDFNAGIEIIEINSDEEQKADENSLNTENDRKYLQHMKKTLPINKTREGQKQLLQEQSDDFRNNIISEDAFHQACTDFYGIDCQDTDNRIPTKQYISFINNSSSSETSTDDTEIFQFNHTVNDIFWNSDDSYNSHKTYKNVEKKTCSTYINNNRQYIFDNNDLYNISSQDTSDSSFAEDEIGKNVDTIRRIATPIPTYIPRLILRSPSLPTVTEFSEPKKASTNVSGSSQSKSQHKKCFNSWFDDGNNAETDQILRQEQKLSSATQREERRRKLKEIQEQDNLPPSTVRSVPKPKKIQNTRPNPISSETQENCKKVNESQEIFQKNNSNIRNINNNLQKSHVETNHVSQDQDINDPIDDNWIDNCCHDGDRMIEIFDCDLDTTDVGKNNYDSTVIDDINNNVRGRTSPTRFKSAEWSTCAHSVPTLDLSFNSEEIIPWYKRIIKLFQCCK